MRLFFAFMPSVGLANAISLVGTAADPSGCGRLVARSDLHTTLAFLGCVTASELENVRSFACQQRARAFHLLFDRLEFWKNAAAIVMTARSVPSPLEEFQKRFQVGLSLPSRETFRPHVTLVRNVPQGPVLQTISAVRWTPRSFSLVCSDTGGAQSAYTVLDTWPLLYETKKPLKSQ